MEVLIAEGSDLPFELPAADVALAEAEADAVCPELEGRPFLPAKNPV